MRVPQADQSVGLDAPTIPEQQGPRVIPGAFGEDVGAATQKIGEAGVQLGDALSRHIAQQNYWKGQATIADGALKIRNQFQDMAYSTQPVTVQGKFSNTAPLNGQANADAASGGVVTQPKGYLNRIGFNATGSTEDFIKNVQPMRDQFVGQFKGDARLTAEAARHFDTIYSSYYDQVSKHEATQYRTGMNNTFNAQTNATITSTSSANDPASLMAGINQIKNATSEQYKFAGQEDAVIQGKQQDNIANAVSKSVVNTLTSTGDLAKAQSMLDAAKDELPADRYEKIGAMLTTGYQRLQQQSHIADVQKEISGQANLLQQLSAGKGGWQNLDDMANLVQQGTVSEKFAKAYSDVIAAKGNYQPQEDKNQNTPQFIDAIYHAKDQQGIHDTLIKMMEEHKDMSQDQMAILINSALKRSGTLPLSTKFGGSGNPDPKQLNIDSGARAVVNFGRRNNMTPDEIGFVYGSYYNKTSKGMAVPQAIDEATREYAINKYPSLASVEGTPTAVTSPSAGIKYLHFNSNQTVYPERIWNPKSGQFDINTNRAQPAKGDKKP